MTSFESLSCNRAYCERKKQARHIVVQVLRLKADTDAAHVADVSSPSDDDLQEQLIVAEREAMEARAEYELRNKITHNVLVTDPVLKAVHGGEETDFAER